MVMVKVIHDFFFHTLSQHLSCKKILTLGKDEEDVVSFHPTSGFFFWFLKVGWKRSGAAATVESFFARANGGGKNESEGVTRLLLENLGSMTRFFLSSISSLAAFNRG